jgi:xanthine dehydrogenase small subunit
MFRKTIHFTVNGELLELGGSEVFAPLSDTLRYLLRKTGTKVVCAEGDCGACTVMLARCQIGEANRFRSINSCIYPTFSVDGCHLVTVEGLAERGSGLHEIQESMMRNCGGQCGFCTPGFVMSIANLYEHKSKPSEQNVKNYLTGNLCRCTGYQPIIQAALDVDVKKMKTVGDLYPLKNETEILLKKTSGAVLIETENRELFAPATIKEAVEYKSRKPKARLFSGATDLGVQINKGKNPGSNQMSLHLIQDLYAIAVEKGRVRVGARATLDQLQRAMAEHVPVFAEFLNIFASQQIKNSGTLIGNLANGSPIADTTPFLLATDAQITLVGPKAERVVPVNAFFKGYKSFEMKDDEFITEISWDLAKLKNAKIGLYKISQRRDLDISCVNACFAFHKEGDVVTEAKIVFGGVGPIPLRFQAIEKSVCGKKLNAELVGQVKRDIAKAIQPLSDVRGTSEYRLLMVQQLFQKYVQEHHGL